MDYNKLKEAVYAQSWVENYLEAMVKDQPQHKILLDYYLLVSQALTQIRRESSSMEDKLALVHKALHE